MFPRTLLSVCLLLALGVDAPTVVSTDPAPGATSVAGPEVVLTARFSEPMRDGSWSIVGAPGGELPEIVGDPWFSDPSTWHLRVRVRPDTEYAVGLNSERRRNFVSADGSRPLVPFVLRFRTRGAAAPATGPVGEWVYREGEVEVSFAIAADGRYVRTIRSKDGADVVRGSWRVEGDRLVIRADGEGPGDEERLGFRLDGDVLVVSVPGGREMRLSRRGAPPPPPAAPPAGPAGIEGRWVYREGEVTLLFVIAREGRYERMLRGPQGEETVVGAWRIEGARLVIRPDGEGAEGEERFDWRFDGDLLVLTVPGEGEFRLKREGGTPPPPAPPAPARGPAGTWEARGEGYAATLVLDPAGRFRWTIRTGRGENVSEGAWREADGAVRIRPAGAADETSLPYRMEGADVLVLKVPGQGDMRFARTGAAPPTPAPAPGAGGPAFPLPPAPGGHIVYTKYEIRHVAAAGLEADVPVPGLWVMNADGSGKRRLFAPENDFVAVKEPHWSADYRRLVFSSNYRPAVSALIQDIFVAEADGSGLRRLTGNELIGPAPAGYGSVKGILIDNLRDEGEMERSRDTINISAQGSDGIIVHPSSPEIADVKNERGDKLGKLRVYEFFVPRVAAGAKVWIKIWVDNYIGRLIFTDVTAGEISDLGNVELNEGNYYAGYGQISTDGRIVVGVGGIASMTETGGTHHGGAENLCVYRGDNGAVIGMFEPTRAKGEDARYPALSPDGRTVAVCWGVFGAENLALLTVDDIVARRLEPRVIVPGQRILFEARSVGAATPAWSPDGKTIAFTRTGMNTQFCSGNLCVVNADGSGLRQITNVPPTQICTAPCFSPDGTKLAFTVLTGKYGVIKPEHLVAAQFTGDVYCLDLASGQVTRLTDDGLSGEPAWGR